ncbi:transglutaminase domain-containing protein [Legionella beliardensis]|uniref:Transglutaminase domain-containing protein n=1 Tax=Legionella beliardensis TaxID=91822 RepID=A0A378I1I2_9GAMM|nr:DUF3488 and transglutaminase-like domain-containing protein [Legionella beliardensis]STX29048.1 transglutaminase domain-containing protein [Legionella beliardensis]
MTNSEQRHFLTLTRYTLLVVLLCYIPHFFQSPSWVMLLAVAAIGYKFIAAYFNYPILPVWIRVILVMASLALLKIAYGNMITSGFFIGFLIIFVGLKCLEIYKVRDIKFIIICNFYLIFSALVINQELWIVVYLFAAILANLMLMFKLSVRQVSLKYLSRKSATQLLIAIPFSLLLFYIFPRISKPLWQVPSQSISQLGFSESMSPGSMTELFNDDRTALRVTFNNKPILNGYWQGLVLNHYNGISWNSVQLASAKFNPLVELTANQNADYEVILEPHQKKWLFYLSLPLAARPRLLFSTDYGLVRAMNEDMIQQRFAYGIITMQTKPQQTLNDTELRQYLQLPNKVNPQLAAWAKAHFTNLQNDPKLFIRFLQQYIHQQPFYYTLAPDRLSLPNQMDDFWFNTKKGYCEHYAGAIAFILRAVGIPARVVVGYQGGIWNSVGHYLDIQQNNAHAWVEYWQAPMGWQLIDPTSFIAPERIDQAIRDFHSSYLNQTDNSFSANLSWLQRSQFFIESLRFFAERWLLFYNKDAQQDLLKKIGLEKLTASKLLQATIIFFLIFLFVIGFLYTWRQHRQVDQLLKAYQQLQKELRRFNVPTKPSMTLKKQCNILINKLPRMAPEISLFLSNYERLRLQQSESNVEDNRRHTVLLFNALKRKLTKINLHQ